MDRRGKQATSGGREDLLHEAARVLAAKPFRSHPLLTNGHAQTIARWAWPRRYHAHLDEAEPPPGPPATCMSRPR